MKHWILATRPKTLWAGIAPILMGNLLALQDEMFELWVMVLSFIAAVLLQIGTNFTNDYCDAKKGTDAYRTVGPTRVVQAQLIAPRQMLIGIYTVFFLAVLGGMFLVARGGWPIFYLGIICLFSAIFYTAGPFPLGYHGLGDLFVFINFGPVGVVGSFYLQTFQVNASVFIASIASGSLATAIIVVNNLRDMEEDRTAHKNTLAVIFGKNFVRLEYLLCMLTAAIIPIILYFYNPEHRPIIIASGVSFFALPLIKSIFKDRGSILNKSLANTAKLFFVYNAFFSIMWLL